jgi:hypothetical protein
MDNRPTRDITALKRANRRSVAVTGLGAQRHRLNPASARQRIAKPSHRKAKPSIAKRNPATAGRSQSKPKTSYRKTQPTNRSPLTRSPRRKRSVTKEPRRTHRSPRTPTSHHAKIRHAPENIAGRRPWRRSLRVSKEIHRRTPRPVRLALRRMSIMRRQGLHISIIAFSGPL